MRTFILTFLVFLGTKSFGQTNQLSKFSDLSINSMGDLTWTISYPDKNGFSIVIEKFQDNKWTRVTGWGLTLSHELNNGSDPSNSASTKMTTYTYTSRLKFHKGTNTFRLVMTQPDKVISEEVKLVSDSSNDDGSLWIVNNKIILDEKVQYEILNSVGATLTKGEDQNIDISSLPAGSYFLYTKTSTRPFTK